MDEMPLMPFYVGGLGKESPAYAVWVWRTGGWQAPCGSDHLDLAKKMAAHYQHAVVLRRGEGPPDGRPGDQRNG